ncbi:MAG: nucleoside triphosphate pyrophosphohydrolase [Gemmatimonadetes bacterium]|nr:nucleoside triphosphate pyrophosphohydrolase [Gemmatimonadota bacterium]
MTEPTPPEPTFEGLLDLVRILLSDGGCAWDRAQTPVSLLPYLIEEAYEVAEAIREERGGDVPEELGDLALHVAFQVVLAERSGAFGDRQVFSAVLDKMIRRHPHVFPPRASSPAAAGLGPCALSGATAEGWEELKRRERAAAGAPGTLDGLPKALPALLRAQRLQERAAAVGFDWPDAGGPLAKVREELEEVLSLMDPVGGVPEGDLRRASLEAEVGDLIFAVVNFARHLGVNAEIALEFASAKFRLRFESVERLAVERGLDLAAASLAELDGLWDQVKGGER